MAEYLTLWEPINNMQEPEKHSTTLLMYSLKWFVHRKPEILLITVFNQ